MRMALLEVLTHPGGKVSNPDIAAALSISPNTVKTQLKTIFSEWNVTGRTQAGVVYLATQVVKR